jgi:ankyrin repeat protein
MSIFLNESTTPPPLLVNPPADLDLNLTLDDQGHTAVHWAAALARIRVLELLLNQGANGRAMNMAGESALMRAVMVTNNFDNQTFPHLLVLLSDAISLCDNRGKNVLHHIVLTSGIKGRTVAGRYYLESLITRIAKLAEEGKMSFKDVVNVQDINGDTPLNIASRLGNRNMAEMLVDVGADVTIANKAGLKPTDFGMGVSVLPSVQNVSSGGGKVVAYSKPDEPEFSFVSEATKIGQGMLFKT